MWAIISFASTKKLYIYRFSRSGYAKHSAETGTLKHDIAVEIGKRFPHLAKRVPPKESLGRLSSTE